MGIRIVWALGELIWTKGFQLEDCTLVQGALGDAQLGSIGTCDHASTWTYGNAAVGADKLASGKAGHVALRISDGYLQNIVDTCGNYGIQRAVVGEGK